MLPEYLDFDLKIDAGTYPDYRVRATCLHMNESRDGWMRFPFDERELENRLLKVQNVLLHGGNRRRKLLSTEEKVVQEFGQFLFDTLFTGEINTLYRRSQHETTHQAQGIRLRLTIEAPELTVLPWEFLYDSLSATYICRNLNTPLIRYLALPQPIQTLKVTPPLRILGMIASPKTPNITPIDIQLEQARLETTLQPLQEKGLVQLTWLKGQSWRELQQTLRRHGPWHIFHFIGHGDFDEQCQEGRILFADEQERPLPFYATELGSLLNHRTLRLVLLNACGSGQGGQQDRFSSIAATLVQQGVPAVLSMQYAITDQAAIEFSHSFYAALTDSMPIDAAMVEARKSMYFSNPHSLEWGIPVLYMQSPDGVLFENKKVEVADSKIEGKLKVEIKGEVKNQNDPTNKKDFPEYHEIDTEPKVIEVSKATKFDVPSHTNLNHQPASISQPHEDPVDLKSINPEWVIWVLGLVSIGFLLFIFYSAQNTLPPIGEERINPKDGAIYAYIPTGEFLMGNNNGNSDEQPAHTVHLGAFWIMKTEVTNAQYTKCIEAKVCGEPKNTFWADTDMKDHPVVNVSWYQARTYALWSGGRLPTEAEWEKTARGSDSHQYPWGNQWDNTKLNYCDINCEWSWKDNTGDDGYKKTAPVGAYSEGASPYGVLDMAGNVQEWTADWYDADYYESSISGNPSGPRNGTHRVLRGGAFDNNRANVRSDDRYSRNPDFQDSKTGFRVMVSGYPIMRQQFPLVERIDE